jgi:hypothetical protein
MIAFKPASFLRAFTFLFTLGVLSWARGASAANEVDQAQAVSRAWLASIDQGKYEESYNFTCDATRDKFSQDRWVTVLEAMRGKIYGPVISRTQLSHVYKPNGITGLNGECVVLTYDSMFQNVKEATETVVLTWQDGKWRGASYFAEPKADENATAPTAPQTEVQTQQHVAPNKTPVPQ